MRVVLKGIKNANEHEVAKLLSGFAENVSNIELISKKELAFADITLNPEQFVKCITLNKNRSKAIK